MIWALIDMLVVMSFQIIFVIYHHLGFDLDVHLNFSCEFNSSLFASDVCGIVALNNCY